jgi:hypothetical protein
MLKDFLFGAPMEVERLLFGLVIVTFMGFICVIFVGCKYIGGEVEELRKELKRIDSTWWVQYHSGPS